MSYNVINLKGKLVDLSAPLVMGILNVTPDSFYEQSRKQSEKEIIDRVAQILNEGGSIIDIGAQSTRPTSDLLSAEEEIKRLSFALNIINREFPKATISVDTFYSKVASFCVENHDVAIINDISGGEMDNDMFSTIARLQVPYILMHMRGTPQTMQSLTSYDNLIEDIFYYFSEKTTKLRMLGVNDIILDPGFGFSKNIDQNYELMSRLKDFHFFHLPLLIGVSRKSMIYNLLGGTPSDSLNGTTAINMYALMNGANILRVHDVKEAVETIRINNKINNPYK